MLKLTLLLASLFIFQACTASSNSGPSARPSRPLVTAEQFSAIDPSLVTVKSTYTDATTQKQIRVNGSGFIIRMKDNRFIVLTASHVSQGENLEIAKENQVFEIVNRYYPRKSDIELIEIKSNGPIETNFEYQDFGILWKAQKQYAYRQIDGVSFVPKNSWIKDETQVEDNNFVSTNPQPINCDMYCYTLTSDALIQPGYSGSPLITKLAEPIVDTNNKVSFDLREGFDSVSTRGQYFLRGLAVKRDRFFPGSTFIGTRVIKNTINEYLTGKPSDAEKEANKWLLNSNVLIRKVSYDTYEASAVGGVVGNGVSADGGDDLLAAQNDSPLELMNKVSAFPVATGEKERLFWFFMTRSSKGAMYSAVAWFDAETSQYVRRFVMGVSPEKEDFVTLFFQRLFNVDTKKPVLSVDQKSRIVFTPDEVQVEVNSATPFQFSLRRDGKICQATPIPCTDKYMPIIEVLARDQKTWLIVDLRSIMFFDLGTGIRDRFTDVAITKMPEAEYRQLFDDVMADEMLTLKLKYRKKQIQTRALTIEQLQFETVTWLNKK